MKLAVFPSRSLVVAGLALAIAAALFATPTFAQDGSVTLPWGDWLAGALSYVSEAVIAAVAALIGILARNLAPGIRDYILSQRVEQLLARAADYGIAAAAGAVKGKTLDIAVTNEVLEKAAEYAIANAPALAERLGKTLRPKLLARLAPYTAPEVTAAKVYAEVAK
jgi:hypothetical protein